MLLAQCCACVLESCCLDQQKAGRYTVLGSVARHVADPTSATDKGSALNHDRQVWQALRLGTMHGPLSCEQSMSPPPAAVPACNCSSERLDISHLLSQTICQSMHSFNDVLKHARSASSTAMHTSRCFDQPAAVAAQAGE